MICLLNTSRFCFPDILIGYVGNFPGKPNQKINKLESIIEKFKKKKIIPYQPPELIFWLCHCIYLELVGHIWSCNSKMGLLSIC